MKGTKPTAGRPHHPVVTSVLYETTGKPSAEPAEKFAAMLQARTVGHLEHVDVGAIVSAYLEEHQNVQYMDEGYAGFADALQDHGQGIPCPGCRQKGAPPVRVAQDVLNLTALVETVLDEARRTLQNRLSIDMAAILIPRLKGPRSV